MGNGQVSVFLDSQLRMHLKATAIRLDVTLSDLIRSYVRQGLDGQETEPAPVVTREMLERALIALFGIEQMAVMTLDRVRAEHEDGRTLLTRVSTEALDKTAALMDP